MLMKIKNGEELMKILILDDDIIRHRTFQKRYSNHYVKHVQTYGHFIHELINNSPWDLIHLDHDLGDEIEGDFYVDEWGTKKQYTGRHAAQKICDLDKNLLPTKVIIHSLNPSGAQTMKSLLSYSKIPVSWIPFGCDKNEFDQF